MSDADPTAPPDDDPFTFVDPFAPTDDPTHPSWALAGPVGAAAFSDVSFPTPEPDDPDAPEEGPEDPVGDDGGHGGGVDTHTSTSPLGPWFDDPDGTHGGATVPAGGGPTGGDTPPGSGTEPEGPHEPSIDFPEVPPDPQGPTDPPQSPPAPIEDCLLLFSLQGCGPVRWLLAQDCDAFWVDTGRCDRSERCADMNPPEGRCWFTDRGADDTVVCNPVTICLPRGVTPEDIRQPN